MSQSKSNFAYLKNRYFTLCNVLRKSRSFVANDTIAKCTVRVSTTNQSINFKASVAALKAEFVELGLDNGIA